MSTPLTLSFIDPDDGKTQASQHHHLTPHGSQLDLSRKDSFIVQNTCTQ